MGKGTFFSGQPIFNQIISLIPKSEVYRISKKNQSDRYVKKFFFYDHLITMLFCSFHKCSSLREVITGIQAYGGRLNHIGIENTPRRSTLSDSNSKRNSNAFEDLFHYLVKHYLHNSPDSRLKEDIKRVFLIDSTTITLFSNIMKGAGTYGLNGKKKGGAKAHVVLDAEENIPVFIRITEARMSDKTFLNYVNLPENTVVVMDKGYNMYNVYASWGQKGIKYYTRINKAAVYNVIEETTINEENKNKGVLKDQRIILGNPRTQNKAPLQEARLVQYKDPISLKTFEFLSNDMENEPIEIAEMYKRRWQIEIFFKRFKQNFPLNYFLGDNENAIKIQIWCSLIADLLIKIVMDRTARKNRKWSFANLCGFIRLHLGTYINMYAFLRNPEKALLKYKPPDHVRQLTLF